MITNKKKKLVRPLPKASAIRMTKDRVITVWILTEFYGRELGGKFALENASFYPGKEQINVVKTLYFSATGHNKSFYDTCYELFARETITVPGNLLSLVCDAKAAAVNRFLGRILPFRRILRMLRTISRNVWNDIRCFLFRRPLEQLFPRPLRTLHFRSPPSSCSHPLI